MAPAAARAAESPRGAALVDPRAEDVIPRESGPGDEDPAAPARVGTGADRTGARKAGLIASDPDGSADTPLGGWAFRYGREAVAGDKFRPGRTLDDGVPLSAEQVGAAVLTRHRKAAR